MAEMMVISVADFLSITRATVWHEAHWSLAGTLEQAQGWFAARGISGKIYRVPFGWWCVRT